MSGEKRKELREQIQQDFRGSLWVSVVQRKLAPARECDPNVNKLGSSRFFVSKGLKMESSSSEDEEPMDPGSLLPRQIVRGRQAIAALLRRNDPENLPPAFRQLLQGRLNDEGMDAAPTVMDAQDAVIRGGAPAPRAACPQRIGGPHRPASLTSAISHPQAKQRIGGPHRPASPTSAISHPQAKQRIGGPHRPASPTSDCSHPQAKQRIGGPHRPASPTSAISHPQAKQRIGGPPQKRLASPTSDCSHPQAKQRRGGRPDGGSSY